MNNAVMEKVIELNDEPFTKKEGSMRLLFDREEAPSVAAPRQFQLFERARAKGPGAVFPLP